MLPLGQPVSIYLSCSVGLTGIKHAVSKYIILTELLALQLLSATQPWATKDYKEKTKHDFGSTLKLEFIHEHYKQMKVIL